MIKTSFSVLNTPDYLTLYVGQLWITLLFTTLPEKKNNHLMILEPHIELVGKCGSDLLFGRVPGSSECLGDTSEWRWVRENE